MTQKVLWVVGGPRAGTNLVGTFLNGCGPTGKLAFPIPTNDWNPNWAADGELNGMATLLLGCDPIIGLQLPVYPSKPDKDLEDKIKQHVSTLADLADKESHDYLLCAGYLPTIAPLIFAALPDRTHVLLEVTRIRANRVSSLVARSGANATRCGTYIDACDAAKEAIKTQFTKIVTVSFETIVAKASDKPALREFALNFGIENVPDAALDLFKADSVRFS